jgi:tetratricopeptide (TPR) repeat protein
MFCRSLTPPGQPSPPPSAPNPKQGLKRVDQILGKLAIEILASEFIKSRASEINPEFFQRASSSLSESVKIKISQGHFSLEKYVRWQTAAESFITFNRSLKIKPSDFKLEQIHHRLLERKRQLETHFSIQELEEFFLLAVMLNYTYQFVKSQALTEDCRATFHPHINQEDLECLTVLFEECFKLRKAYECLYCAHVRDMLIGDDFRTKMNLATIYQKMYFSSDNKNPQDARNTRDWREKARVYAKKANELDPTDHHAIYLYATVCADEGCFPEAIKYYQLLISLEERTVTAWDSLLRIYEILDHAPGNYEKAIHCCDKLLAYDEPKKRIFYEHKKSEIKIAMMRLTNIEEAEKLLNQKLKEYPDSPVYNFLKQSFRLEKVKTMSDKRSVAVELALIEKELPKLTSLGGLLLSVSHLKARMMMQVGNVGLALKYYREALRNEENGTSRALFSINRVSLIMEYCDTFFSAEGEPLTQLPPILSQVTKMAPDYYEAWFLKAQAEGKLGFHASGFHVKQQYCLEAIRSYQRCIELKGNHFHIFSQIAVLYLQIANKHEAIKYARLTFEERNRMHKISLTSDPKLIELLLACDLISEAIEAYQFGLCYQKTEASMAIKLQILQAQKQIVQALQEGLCYLKKHPKSVVIQADVAFLFYLQGKYEESLKFSGFAIDLDPSLPYPCYVKALAYQSIGKYSLAIHYYRKSLQNGVEYHLDVSGRLFECLVANQDLTSALDLFKKISPSAPNSVP